MPDGPRTYPAAYRREPRLLDRVKQVIRARHYSPRTETVYIGWIKRFILFHGKRHPNEMGEPEVTRFLSSLAARDKMSPSTQNQALSALLFLYKDVLRRDLHWLGDVVRAKRPIRLPVVLSPPWLMASLLYGAGLRLLECCRLRVKDVDLARNELTVRDGKGRKDRMTLIPGTVRDPLGAHLERVRTQHQRDLRAGAGSVELPYALRAKYPRGSTSIARLASGAAITSMSPWSSAP